MSAAIKIAPVRESRVLGFVREPDAYFAKVKQDMFAKLGDLSNVKVPLNRILVCVWATKDGRTGVSGSKIIMPDVVLDENKWQGVSALVVKMGPHCYPENDGIAFVEGDKCQVGDWVFFRKGEGVRVEVWLQECVMLENERCVRMVLPRPDMVY